MDFLPLLYIVTLFSAVSGSFLPEDLLVNEPLHRIKVLGNISDSPDVLTRSFLSPAHSRAARQISEWMADAGMDTWIDFVGNVHGRVGPQNPSIPVVVIGSHYDTVVDAGLYDGVLGIVSAISAVKYVSEMFLTEKRGPEHSNWTHPVEIVAFADEEGVRFQTTFLGSRALAGSLVRTGLLAVIDKNGQTLSQILMDNGANGEADVEKLSIAPQQMKAYIEIHSEQGPKLMQMGSPLAVVSGIAGQTFLQVSVVGEQNHAGTVPMSMRRDAISGAAEMIYKIEEICTTLNKYLPQINQKLHVHDKCKNSNKQLEVCNLGNDLLEETGVMGDEILEDTTKLVCTVGDLDVWPGASNVISGLTNFTIDVRSGSDRARYLALQEIQTEIKGICTKRNLDCLIKNRHEARAVDCSSDVTWKLSNAAKQAIADTTDLMKAGKTEQTSHEWMCRNTVDKNCAHWNTGTGVPTLVSGAGHDALAMADVGPVGMVFVRDNGISHSPKEHVDPADVSAAVLTIARYLLNEMNDLS